MRSLTLQSPAKINLFLKVLGRRRDGYHRIVTLFHRISLCDTLRLAKSEKGLNLRCSDPSLPLGGSNLITRAYQLLKHKFPHLKGVSVYLKKKIPLGGGLGGGSSNAATFLFGMRKIYGLKLSEAEWVLLGKKLGVDVPFFLHDVNQAIGTNLGDCIKKRPSRRKYWFLLVCANKGLKTKNVYQNLPEGAPAASLTKVSRAVKLLCDFLDRGDLWQVANKLHNDLESAAFRLRPSLRKVMENFEKVGVRTARMSGSGSAVFAIFSSPKQARKLMRIFRKASTSVKLVLCHSF